MDPVLAPPNRAEEMAIGVQLDRLLKNRETQGNKNGIMAGLAIVAGAIFANLVLPGSGFAALAASAGIFTGIPVLAWFTGKEVVNQARAGGRIF